MPLTAQELLAKVERQRQEIDALFKLWKVLFPEFKSPGCRQFTVWLNMYPFETVVSGLETAAQWYNRKLQEIEGAATEVQLIAWGNTVPSPITATDIIRYASGVMKGIKQGR